MVEILLANVLVNAVLTLFLVFFFYLWGKTGGAYLVPFSVAVTYLLLSFLEVRDYPFLMGFSAWYLILAYMFWKNEHREKYGFKDMVIIGIAILDIILSLFQAIYPIG